MMISLPNLEKPRSNGSNGNPYPTHIQHSYINRKGEPLKDAGGTHTQVSFKGSPIKQLKNFNNSEVKTVAHALKEIRKYVSRKINAGLDYVEDTLTELLDNKNELIEKGLKEEKLDRLRIDKPIWESFKDSVSALPKWIISLPKRLFADTQTKEKFKTINHIKSLKNSLTGYLLEIQQHATNFDKAFQGNALAQVLKNGDEKALGKFLKNNRLNKKILIKTDKNPDGLITMKALKEGLSGSNTEEFIENLRNNYIGDSINACERNKLGGHLSKFSNDGVQLVNRLVSGGTTSAFIANDFYNLKMATSGKKDEAKDQWKKRFKQYTSYIGIYAYAGYIINSTFVKISNKSLPFAMLLGAASAVIGDVVSRVINKVPLYPKKIENVSDKPYIIHSTPIKQNPYASPLKTYNALKGTNKNSVTNVAFTGNLLNKKIPFEAFKETYNTLIGDGSRNFKEHAEEMLRIAGKYTGLNESASLEQIEKAVNGGDIIIGKNAVHNTGKEFMEAIKSPFRALLWVGTKIANLGLRIAGKDPIELRKRDKFKDAKFVQNIVEMVKEGNLEKKTSEFRSPKVMDYSASDLSTAMKLTGFTSLPFIALDTYNETLQTTKNSNITKEKTQQRVLQDTSRQAVSFWAVKSFNDMFAGLINHSLGGAALGVLLNCAGYEALTRAAVGQPILPKSKEEMKEIEKKRFKKQNWFTKILGGKIKMHEDKVIIGSSSLQKPACIPLNTKFNYLSYN